MRPVACIGKIDDMSQDFLVECYWSNPSMAALRESAMLIAAATAELRAECRHITLLGSVLIPADEVCFWRFNSTTIAEVELVTRRCGLAVDRVTPSIDLSAPFADRDTTYEDGGRAG